MDLLDDLVCVIIMVESMAWIHIFAYLCYICGCDKQQQQARHAAAAGQALTVTRYSSMKYISVGPGAALPVVICEFQSESSRCTGGGFLQCV